MSRCLIPWLDGAILSQGWKEALRDKFVTGAKGRPLKFFMTAGQASDDTGTSALRDSLSKAAWRIADHDCNAGWFRQASREKGDTTPQPVPEVSWKDRPRRQAPLQAQQQN